MKSIWRKIFVVLVLALIAGTVGLVEIYPYRPRSLIVWCVFSLSAVPVWIFVELVGGRFVTFVNAKVLDALSPVTRIIIGVVVGSGCLVLMMWSFHFLQPFLVKWGS